MILYYIKIYGKNITCIIWITNCTFVSNFVYSTSIITAKVSLFNTELNLFNCEFYYNKQWDASVIVTVTSHFDFEVNRVHSYYNVACTNITFNKCNFSDNTGGSLALWNYNPLANN